MVDTSKVKLQRMQNIFGVSREHIEQLKALKILNKKIIMKKVFLFCVLVCTGQMYGMEAEACEYFTNVILKTYSYISSFLFTPDPQFVQDLRKDKCDFEHTLFFRSFIIEENISRNVVVGFDCSVKKMFHAFFQSSTNLKPINFLRYCFYQFCHTDQNKQEMQQLISQYPDLHPLDEYKKIEINGYSAIGAAILAPEVSIENKREFIEQLLNLGFLPTKKDVMIAKLQLYDAIPPEEKEKMMLFLRQKELLPEIKRNIISCISSNLI